MSLKSLIQIIIVIVIFIILGGVYFQYFSKDALVVDDSKNNQKQEIDNDLKTETMDQKIQPNENILVDKKTNKNEFNDLKIVNNSEKNENTQKIQKIEETKDQSFSNLVKEVEYITTDKNGNRYQIIAESGKTNKSNKNVLDLKNVNGEIQSDKRSTIYIVSELAKYDSINLDSKFYKNVVIKFEDKKITCENFEINMDTSVALAYVNVVVTDPKSTIKASKITFNIETKEIEINPDNNISTKVKINTKP